MIDTVIFDAGNVLVKIHPNRASASLARLFGVSIDEMHEILFRSEHLHAFELGRITEGEMCDRLKAATQTNPPDEAIMSAACDMFAPIDDIGKIIRSLKDACVKLAILSNTNVWHWRYLQQHYPVVNLIDQQILSFEVGLAKPQKEIYLKALDKVNATASQCLFFDDLEENVQAANDCGIEAYQIQNSVQIRNILCHKGFLACES